MIVTELRVKSQWQSWWMSYFDRQFGFRTLCNFFTDLDLGVVTWCVFRPGFASESP